MKKEKLSSLCEIKNGYAFKSKDYVPSGYRVIRITNVQKGFVVDDDPKFIPESIAEKANNFKLILGDILISLTGNVGRVGRIQSCHLPAVLNQRVGLIRPISENLDDNFLFQYLNSSHFEQEAITNANGVAQLNLSSKWIGNHKIPLPPLDDQIRIAHLLGKVEGLIARRKRHLQQLDELLKSVFLEMFGIRDDTYKKWNIDKLTYHAEVVSGVTKGKKYKTDKLIEVPYLRVANVQDGYFELDEIKTIAVTSKEFNKLLLEYGDLLLTEGGDPDKLGRGSVWEEQISNCIHQNHIFRVRVKDALKLNPYYLSGLVGSVYGKAYFLRSAKQTTGIASINSTQLKNFPVVIPPISLQNQFATIVEKVEEIKSQYQHNLTELENLYGALSQKAFKGELDLSRIPLTAEDMESRKAKDIETGDEQRLAESIGLPEPTDLAALKFPQGRKAEMERYLESYLEQLDGEPFCTDRFMHLAQQKMDELLEDEPPELGVADYDWIKERVFRLLENGQLTQTYNDAANRVQLTREGQKE